MLKSQELAKALEADYTSRVTSLAYADTQQRYEVEEVEKAKGKWHIARRQANLEVFEGLTPDEQDTMLNAVVEASRQLDYTLGETTAPRNPAACSLRKWANRIKG